MTQAAKLDQAKELAAPGPPGRLPTFPENADRGKHSRVNG